MAGGAPTKYKPEYCDLVIQVMSEGASLVEFSSSLNVTRDTVYEWARVHPKFSDALNIAREKCQTWWEMQGRKSLVDQTRDGDSDRFNDRLWKMNMGARFPKDWSEKFKAEEDISSITSMLEKFLGD